MRGASTHDAALQRAAVARMPLLSSAPRCTPVTPAQLTTPHSSNPQPAPLQVACAQAVYTHALMLAGRWGDRSPPDGAGPQRAAVKPYTLTSALLQVAYAWAVYTHALMLAGRWGERAPLARALLITSALQLAALVAAAAAECLRAPSAGEAAVLKQALLSGGSSGVTPAEALSTDPRRKRQRPWCVPPGRADTQNVCHTLGRQQARGTCAAAAAWRACG